MGLAMTMNRSTSFRRVRARLRDERGFSLLETVIAVTVIFGSLLALAYTASVGFGYQGLSRQRQAANGIANEVMEQIRGLAYEHIEAGLSSTDLTGDANIVTCGGVNRFISCTADPDVPGSGEMIVSSPGLSTAAPLVPHRSSTAPNANPERDGTTYQWSTYITQDDAVDDAPYRVTVWVTWTGGDITGSSKVVRVQSYIWSPIGCRSVETHPFAAPCQPFFYGTATVPQSFVTVNGTVDQLSFSSGQLITPSVVSSAQQEQIQQIQGTWQGSGVSITDGAGTRTAGGTSLSTNADSDPATLAGLYSRARCPTETTCAGGAMSSSSAGNTITFTAPTGTTAESDSAVAAGGANVCPASPDTAEADGLFCGGGRVQQGGALTAALDLQHSANIGPATAVQILAPSAASKTIVNRTAFPSITGCSPASTVDGCVAVTVNRTLGTINIGGLPSSMTAPLGWSGGSAWNGYFLSIVGYQETLTGSAGTNSPLPTASMSGTIYYYNGLGYTAVPVTDVALNGLAAAQVITSVVAGHEIVVNVSTELLGMAAGSTTLTPSSPGGNVTRTDATAQANPPAVVVNYEIVVDGASIADLAITVGLGTSEARGTYEPAAAEGS